MQKVSFLVAASLVLAFGIWAVNRNTESSDLIQRPDSAPSAQRPSEGSLPLSLVKNVTMDDNVTPMQSADGVWTFREAVFALDSEGLSLPMGDERLESEPVDAAWAPRMESLMWSTISTIGEILEVECRTTICRTAVVSTDPESKTISEDRVLMDSFQSIIRSSDGRLDGVRIRPFGTADGRSGITVELSGPPLEAVATDLP